MGFENYVNSNRFLELCYKPGTSLYDLLLVDGDVGTKAIRSEDLAASMFNSFPGVQHKNIYRGKCLGKTITASQLASIRDGTFKDLFIGDYWGTENSNFDGFIIADMNYWCGYGNISWKNHLVLLPFHPIGLSGFGVTLNITNGRMNTTSTNETAYIGSYQYTDSGSLLNLIRTSLNEIFGNILYTHKDYFYNGVYLNEFEHAIVGGWYDSTVDLMDEIMVFGSSRISRINSGNSIIDKTFNPCGQLSLFRLKPEFRQKGTLGTWWLRTTSGNGFIAVDDYGSPTVCDANDHNFIYPVFAIA